MDKDGQLIFYDDPFLIGINIAYQLIEEGKFGDALGKLDELLGRNPDYPVLADAYRTAAQQRCQDEFRGNLEDRLSITLTPTP